MPPSARPIPTLARGSSGITPPVSDRLSHEDAVRLRYESMFIKAMGKLILPPQHNSLPGNTSRRKLNSFHLTICIIIRLSDKSLRNPTNEVISRHPCVPGWQYAVHSLVRYTHDAVKDPTSTCTTFVDALMDETFASLAQGHPGPYTFHLLLRKLERTYGSKYRYFPAHKILQSELGYSIQRKGFTHVSYVCQ